MSWQDSELTESADAAAVQADQAPEGIDAATGAARRGPGGRLYHGETSIDFYGRRWLGVLGSGILLLISVLALVFSGLNLGLDFEGGVAWTVPAKGLSTEQVKEVLTANDINASEAKIQTLQGGNYGTRYRVQVGDQSNAVVTKVQEDLAKAADVGKDEVATNHVSSSWGKSITNKAVKALIVFLILVMVFIAWRLEFRMAIAAIVAMVHDVLLSVGVYAIFGFEVTPATVVAFLTILGFSLYDTIVVFDKVHDNELKYHGQRPQYADIINVSMNQVLMRSLNTSLAAVLPVLSLLVLGSEILGAVTLREFALALLVGLLTGSYSSIFIASPLLAILKERDPKYRHQRGVHATGVELERLVLGGSPSGARREAARARQTGDTTPAAAAPPKPETLLTHPPRPRKKKKR